MRTHRTTWARSKYFNALNFCTRFPFTVNEIFSTELNALLEKFFEAPEVSADAEKEEEKETALFSDKKDEEDKFKNQFFVTGKEEEVNLDDDIEGLDDSETKNEDKPAENQATEPEEKKEDA